MSSKSKAKAKPLVVANKERDKAKNKFKGGHKEEEPDFIPEGVLEKQNSEEEKDDSSEESEDASGSGSEGESDESGDDESWRKRRDKEAKPKGTQGIIEVENPNRAKKQHIKASDLKNMKISDAPASRKEREAVEKQKQAQGKERADLARLAQIRKEREEAAKKREAEQKLKDDKPKSKEGIKK